MQTPKHDEWEHSLYIHKGANRRRARFVRAMEEAYFPISDALTHQGYLILTGDRGTLLLGDCRYADDYYERRTSEGKTRRGRLDLLMDVGIKGELVSPGAVARRLLAAAMFARVRRRSDDRRFAVSLLSEFPSGALNSLYAGGLHFEHGAPAAIVVEPVRSPINEPVSQFYCESNSPDPDVVLALEQLSSQP